jgi:molybdopterin-containing oxidoreductase family membrane subunit
VAELRVAAGIFAVGFLLFTLMLKVAVPISLGEFMDKKEAAAARDAVFAGAHTAQ